MRQMRDHPDDSFVSNGTWTTTHWLPKHSESCSSLPHRYLFKSFLTFSKQKMKVFENIFVPKILKPGEINRHKYINKNYFRGKF